MKIELISIGTELLLGEILNTNVQFLSKELADLGLDVFYQTVVGDNPKRIKNAYKIAFERSDIVITTGGLGPTKDDLTKNVAADFFNLDLILNQDALDNIKNYLNAENLTLSESNLTQAYLPEGCEILRNHNGTAPGCFIKKDNKILILLPGPPNEVIPMFNLYVKPILSKLQTKVLVSKNLNLVGIGESEAADKINEIILNSVNPTVAPYANNNEVRFRITASGKNEKDALNTLQPTIDKLYSIFQDYIYSEDNKSLAEVVVELLNKKGLSLAVAESCTGGLLASTLVNIPNVSSVFWGGIVSYSNESKINLLNINQENLNKYGPVSKNIAEEMSKGVVLKFNSNIGIGITGLAGPDSDDSKKQVGLVYISIFIKNKCTITKKFNFSGNREKIRSKAVTEALNQLRLLLIKGD